MRGLAGAVFLAPPRAAAVLMVAGSVGAEASSPQPRRAGVWEVVSSLGSSAVRRLPPPFRRACYIPWFACRPHAGCGGL